MVRRSSLFAVGRKSSGGLVYEDGRIYTANWSSFVSPAASPVHSREHYDLAATLNWADATAAHAAVDKQRELQAVIVAGVPRNPRSVRLQDATRAVRKQRTSRRPTRRVDKCAI
jgi:hypothetical protein